MAAVDERVQPASIGNILEAVGGARCSCGGGTSQHLPPLLLARDEWAQRLKADGLQGGPSEEKREESEGGEQGEAECDARDTPALLVDAARFNRALVGKNRAATPNARLERNARWAKCSQAWQKTTRKAAAAGGPAHGRRRRRLARRVA